MLSPFFFTFIWFAYYSVSVPNGADDLGFGLAFSLIIGATMGSFFGFPFAIISLIRFEKFWWLTGIGLFINTPLMISGRGFVSELLML